MPTVSLNPRTFVQEPSEGLDSVAPSVVQSTSMREATLPLDQLADGDFFKMELLVPEMRNGKERWVHAGWMYGQKLWHNACRVRCRIAGGQRQVVFDDRTGHSRQFESSGVSEISYPTMMEVVRVDANAVESQGNAQRRTDMNEAQEKALQAKWNVASQMLNKALDGGDAGKIEVAQKRVDTLIAEAEAAGVKLGAREAGAAPAGGASKIKATKVPVPAKDAATDAADKAGLAKLKAKAAPKAPKEKKLSTTQDCLCGCGKETGGKFRPGHDARVKGMLYKVERGLEKFENLPEALKPHVKFAGKSATAGKDNSDYRIVQAPVKFPGRDEIKVV